MSREYQDWWRGARASRNSRGAGRLSPGRSNGFRNVSIRSDYVRIPCRAHARHPEHAVARCPTLVVTPGADDGPHSLDGCVIACGGSPREAHLTMSGLAVPGTMSARRCGGSDRLGYSHASLRCSCLDRLFGRGVYPERSEGPSLWMTAGKNDEGVGHPAARSGGPHSLNPSRLPVMGNDCLHAEAPHRWDPALYG